jgi:hypothetical protein
MAEADCEIIVQLLLRRYQPSFGFPIEDMGLALGPIAWFSF